MHWSCVATQDDLAIANERGGIVWHARHEVHISLAEALALLTLAPCRAAIWTDSKVTAAWLHRAKCNYQLSAALSVVAMAKRSKVNWLPSAWNPADKFTRIKGHNAKHIQGIPLKGFWSSHHPKECLRSALECGEIYTRESDVA